MPVVPITAPGALNLPGEAARAIMPADTMADIATEVDTEVVAVMVEGHRIAEALAVVEVEDIVPDRAAVDIAVAVAVADTGKRNVETESDLVPFLI